MTAVAIVELGHVGLPLAIEFGRQFRAIGYDGAPGKIAHYRRGADPTGEVSGADLASATGLAFTDKPEALAAEADFAIIVVPTLVDVAHRPDFEPLRSASEAVGKHMKRDAIVVYESAVYPGATEEVCIPILEWASGMKWKGGFNVRYSPERISPRRPGAYACLYRENRVRGQSRHGKKRRGAACGDRQCRCAQGFGHPRRRGRKGRRKHAARRGRSASMASPRANGNAVTGDRSLKAGLLMGRLFSSFIAWRCAHV